MPRPLRQDVGLAAHAGQDARKIFLREGSRVEVGKANDEDMERLLYAKLEEETMEFFENPSLEEAADVKDILLAIEIRGPTNEAKLLAQKNKFSKMLDDHDLNPPAVERVREAKIKRKGSFSKGYIIRAKLD